MLVILMIIMTLFNLTSCTTPTRGVSVIDDDQSASPMSLYAPMWAAEPGLYNPPPFKPIPAKTMEQYAIDTDMNDDFIGIVNPCTHFYVLQAYPTSEGGAPMTYDGTPCICIYCHKRESCI